MDCVIKTTVNSHNRHSQSLLSLPSGVACLHKDNATIHDTCYTPPMTSLVDGCSVAECKVSGLLNEYNTQKLQLIVHDCYSLNHAGNCE